mmetsp:Transcript_821/g.2250  ORF Transcript_821/g.2250 Transcript_821/m.2250 type:complete len:252 (-) Transcript_821:789-1544(-)
MTRHGAAATSGSATLATCLLSIVRLTPCGAAEVVACTSAFSDGPRHGSACSAHVGGAIVASVVRDLARFEGGLVWVPAHEALLHLEGVEEEGGRRDLLHHQQVRRMVIGEIPLSHVGPGRYLAIIRNRERLAFAMRRFVRLLRPRAGILPLNSGCVDSGAHTRGSSGREGSAWVRNVRKALVRPDRALAETHDAHHEVEGGEQNEGGYPEGEECPRLVSPPNAHQLCSTYREPDAARANHSYSTHAGQIGE